jgi:2-oxo-3-hexenedioate decarboxylase
MEATLDTAAIADEALYAIDHATRLTPFTSRFEGLDLAAAYRITAQLYLRRIARGEKRVGRKIGFTNRTIWDEYKVFAPIWGYMYDTTLFDISQAKDVAVSRFAEPRLEPEIAFGFSRAPQAGMNEAEILDCVEWVSHGFEIVQSHYPGWKFAAPDTVANGGLHGVFFLGEKVALTNDRAAWLKALSDFEIDLFRDGKRVDTGHARNVLDGPVSALKHFIDLLAKDGENEPLAAGEIITTGTVTKAWPVASGEVWQTKLRGIKLPGIEIGFR